LRKNPGDLVVVSNESHDRGKERLRLHFSSIQQSIERKMKGGTQCAETFSTLLPKTVSIRNTEIHCTLYMKHAMLSEDWREPHVSLLVGQSAEHPISHSSPRHARVPTLPTFDNAKGNAKAKARVKAKNSTSSEPPLETRVVSSPGPHNCGVC
jgi:hypothetical protein